MDAETLAAVPNNYNVVRVRNRWALKLDDRIEYTTTHEPNEWNNRTKCFYRGSFEGLCKIHHPKGSASVHNSTSLLMLHVVNYDHPERVEWVKEPRSTVPWPTKS